MTDLPNTEHVRELQSLLTSFDVHGSAITDDEAVVLRHRCEVEVSLLQLHLHPQHVLVEFCNYNIHTQAAVYCC